MNGDHMHPKGSSSGHSVRQPRCECKRSAVELLEMSLIYVFLYSQKGVSVYIV